ncbi:MAG TPA: RIP metalloprotease RseP [Rhodanobacteraceae bacterium]|nr:RIP metalloprotease RseP [Rhodanobacteraceae bacterium]
MTHFSNIAGSLWWMIVTLGLLVTFHEFGHFIVARACGVKVLRFSVGFGRALWSRTAKSGTEYMIAAIPLGGYVKMLDAREGEVSKDERAQEFTGKPVWQRILIVLAGPVFNLIFAVAALWLMFMVGRPDTLPIVAAPAPQTLAASAGFRAGDLIQSINGQNVATWGDALDTLGSSSLNHQPVSVRVRGSKGGERTLMLALNRLPVDVNVANAFDTIGLKPLPPPPIAATVEHGDPAERAGMHPGDHILAINGHSVSNFEDISETIKAQVKQSPRLQFRIERNGSELTLPVTAKWTDPGDGGGARWVVGIGAPKPPAAITRYGPLRALGESLASAWQTTSTTFTMIGKMLIGHASTKNLSSVITIAQAANTSAQMGLGWFLSFLALVSLSLGILNLLPIPILDGGHLLYYLIEMIKGSPLSERAMVAGQYVGMVLLVMLMGLAFYNDILRLAS